MLLSRGVNKISCNSRYLNFFIQAVLDAVIDDKSSTSVKRSYTFIIKKLFFGFSKKYGGRNGLGRLVCRRKGGGHKRMFRFLDFRRLLWNLEAIVLRFEYDPFRNGFIMLVCYLNGVLSYQLAPSGSKIGDYVINTPAHFLLRNGCSSVLRSYNTGQMLYNVEYVPFSFGQVARAAGCRVVVIRPFIRGSAFIVLRLPSGEERYFSILSIGTVGAVSNENFFLQRIGSAGRSRNKGIRPIVRGVAMNPVDHPHGGGHGKTSGARGRRCKMSFSGFVAKGVPTRVKTKSISFLVRSRRKFKLKI